MTLDMVVAGYALAIPFGVVVWLIMDKMTKKELNR